MTTNENDRSRQPLTPQTLRAIAEARGVPVDDALLEELQPMVADMYELADGIAGWLERKAVEAPTAGKGQRA